MPARAPPSLFGSGTFLTPGALPLGTWVPLTLNLGSVTTAGFDPGDVVQLGVQFVSTISAISEALPAPTDLVFEIDSFID